ncbi:MAG: S9 family peptidase [Alphaproteobacteria bacterium]|nr:S9 family peptidase [Alphaproteobacteria bacterium]
MTRRTIATLLLASSALAATSVSARPMTAEDVAKLENVGAIAIAPDGDRIAYTTVSLPDVTEGEENGGPRQQLRLAYGPDNIRDFLPDDVNVGGVAFSPDGRWVTFLWTKGDEDRAVWGIPVDGGAQQKLATIEGAAVRSYAWSPDGQSMHLVAGPAADKARDGQSKAGFNAIVYEEEARFNRLFRVAIGETPDEEPREITVPGFVSDIKIAPDARFAIIESAPTPTVDDSYTSKRVHILDLASGGVSSVVETPGKIGDVEISPDGSQLSLIAGVDMHDPAATTLYLVDVATAQFRPLNEGAPEAAVDAEWLPDGRLAAVIHKGAQSMLRVYDAGGSVVAEHGGEELILTAVEAAGNRVAVAANSPSHPNELFVWQGNAFERWTAHNPWLSEIDMGEQRTVTYTARDGQAIEGVLIEPVGRIPRGGAPLIMNVHGGPEAHESNGWQTAYSKPGQVAAGQGYAVFLPNYRGSTGYGVAFAKQHQGDYAGKEFDDIVDAKRHLVAEGIADADRVGITGGSYGGFASAWGATFYSPEYAAAVMFVGIANNISKFGTTDIPNEMYLVHERKWPWEEWDELLERSPIFHVDKAETPILIMHGEEDTRVSPTQSYELYRNIKTRKPETPVRLVLYPGEGHGNSQAASRYDYNLRMMTWFDTYLKTGDRKAPMPDPRPELADGTVGTGSSAED